MKQKSLIYLYFSTAILFIIFNYINLYALMIITKSLLMVILLSYFLIKINFKFNLFRKLITAALIFCWFGDINLLFVNVNENFFLLGLVSFLIAHLFYIFSFIKKSNKISILKKTPIYILPFLIYIVGLMWLLFNNLGNMKIPVLIYATVIIFMVIMALNRYGKVPQRSFILVLIGAILFLLSDSFIAINKFAYPFELERLITMSLYVTGQFLIIEGSVKTTLNE